MSLGLRLFGYFVVIFAWQAVVLLVVFFNTVRADIVGLVMSLWLVYTVWKGISADRELRRTTEKVEASVGKVEASVAAVNTASLSTTSRTLEP